MGPAPYSDHFLAPGAPFTVAQINAAEQHLRATNDVRSDSLLLCSAGIKSGLADIESRRRYVQDCDVL